MKRRTYHPDFRTEAIRQFDAGGRSLRELARELDIPSTTLIRWVTEDRTREAVTPRVSTDEHAELLELRRRVRILEQERDILKKAAAFFAQESERTR